MTTRDHAPTGAPCWIDLWSSDVEEAGRFYGGLFGWEAQEPDPTHGGYFMFTRDGVPVAGGMGDMGEMRASDSWRIYLATADMAGTLRVAEAAGARVVVPGTPVDELGVQAVLVDPTGAELGAWQAGTFPGFTVVEEAGAPAWFELSTRDHDRAVAFYRSVFGWETTPTPGDGQPTYTTARCPGAPGEMAGIMGASALPPDGAPAQWLVYSRVGDVDEALARVATLGGSVIAGPDPSPFGRLATIADPMGARLKLQAVDG